MGWFNKKERVPELPPASSIKSLSSQKSSLPELPAFPNSNERLNNEMIKSAIQDSSEENEVSVEELSPDFHFPEPEETKIQEASAPIMKVVPAKISEPIFVRIDKFHEAKKDFEEIKKKLKEIDSVLKKFKEVKIKEDDEISSWSEDIEKIKGRRSDIDDNFFNKI